MKIALLTDGIYPYVMGGMQKHSYFLAKFFANSQVYVDLYHYIPSANRSLENPFTKEELSYINLIEIDYPRARKFPGHYLYERYLYSKEIVNRLMSPGQYDFIYAKGFSAWSLLKQRKELNITTSIGVNFHGYEMFQRWPDFKTGIKLQILKRPVLFNMKKADALFSYGGKINEIIEQKGYKEKIIEISTGIGSHWLRDLEKVSVEDSLIKFIFVGRAERRKGIQEINQMLTNLELSNCEFHFVGPIDETLRVKLDNVYYHGPLYSEEELKKVLDKMDVLLCPSYSEGMPNVIMEGMSRGLAVIATDVGAVNMLVDEGNGWLIKGDVYEGLKQATSDAISTNENELLRKKKESISRVESTYTWEKVIQKTINNLKSD